MILMVNVSLVMGQKKGNNKKSDSEDKPKTEKTKKVKADESDDKAKTEKTEKTEKAPKPDKYTKGDAAVEKTESPKVDKSLHVGQIIFGDYCGECIGHCADFFRLSVVDNKYSLYGTEGNFYYFEDKPLKFTRDHNETKKIHKAMNVLKKLPASLEAFEENNHTFGDPDGHDQCGVIVEIYLIDDSNTLVAKKHFNIDPEEAEEGYDDVLKYAGLIRKTIVALR